MKHFNRFLATFLAALLFVSLSACAPNLVAQANTPTPEPVQTATPTATPTLSPVPTEVPTPTLDEFGFSEERKAELNQQIQDFLSYQGEFTREKISEMMMTTISPLDRNEVKLGFVDTQPQIQGYFFDYFEKEIRILMLMGFDGSDGNRFVTLVDIPLLYPFDDIGSSMLDFFKYKVNDIFGSDSTTGSVNASGNFVESSEGNIDMIRCHNRSDIVTQLNTLKNKVVVLSLSNSIIDITTIPSEDSSCDWLLDYYKEVNSKVGLSFGLFQLVSANDIPYENYGNGDTSSILKVEDINSVGNVDISRAPLLMTISYFAG